VFSITDGIADSWYQILDHDIISAGGRSQPAWGGLEGSGLNTVNTTVRRLRGNAYTLCMKCFLQSDGWAEKHALCV
jgi:hypothetical protein